MAWIYGNRYLDADEMLNNAKIVQEYGLASGWSSNAICAILGNMEAESTINPGVWENLDPYWGGYGLVQWTPYTKYSNWAGLGWKNNGDKQLQRIDWEAEHNEQWFYNEEIGQAPPYSLSEFLVDDTTPIVTMANYFLWFYEHPDNPIQPVRGQHALAWYERLDWDVPPGPGPEPPEPPEPEPRILWWILFKFRGRGMK